MLSRSGRACFPRLLSRKSMKLSCEYKLICVMTTQPYLLWDWLSRKIKPRTKRSRIFPSKPNRIHFALCNNSVFVIKRVQKHSFFPFVRFGCTVWQTEINNPVHCKQGKYVYLEYDRTVTFWDLSKLPLLTWSWKLARNSAGVLIKTLFIICVTIVPWDPASHQGYVILSIAIT